MAGQPQRQLTRRDQITTWMTRSDTLAAFGTAIRQSGVTPEQVSRIALTTILGSPQLQKCTLPSIGASIVTALQLGFEPDNVSGMVYLVPYGKVCQLIIGYRGFVQLAYRSGQVKDIAARVVYDKDKFDVDYAAVNPITHKPCFLGDPGHITFAYAVARTTLGGVVCRVMTRNEIEAVRDKHSAGYRSKPASSPWTTDPVAMFEKTPLRRVCKMIPSSVLLQRAVTLDETSMRPDIAQPLDLYVLPDDVVDEVPEEPVPAQPASLVESIEEANPTLPTQSAAPDTSEPVPHADAPPAMATPGPDATGAQESALPAAPPEPSHPSDALAPDRLELLRAHIRGKFAGLTADQQRRLLKNYESLTMIADIQSWHDKECLDNLGVAIDEALKEAQ